jgi:hypothetical protein
MRHIRAAMPQFPHFIKQQNHNKDSPAPSYCSIERIYSELCAEEANSSTGNFSNEESFLDELFSDPGLLMKDNSEVIDPRIIPERADITKELLVNEVYSRNFLYNINLHTFFNGPNRPSAGLAGRMLSSITNIVTWFKQRRRESFWGRTMNEKEVRAYYRKNNVNGFPSERHDSEHSSQVSDGDWRTGSRLNFTVENSPFYYTPSQPATEQHGILCGKSPFIGDQRFGFVEILEYIYKLRLRNFGNTILVREAAWKLVLESLKSHSGRFTNKGTNPDIEMYNNIYEENFVDFKARYFMPGYGEERLNAAVTTADSILTGIGEFLESERTFAISLLETSNSDQSDAALETNTLLRYWDHRVVSRLGRIGYRGHDISPWETVPPGQLAFKKIIEAGGQQFVDLPQIGEFTMAAWDIDNNAPADNMSGLDQVYAYPDDALDPNKVFEYNPNPLAPIERNLSSRWALLSVLKNLKTKYGRRESRARSSIEFNMITSIYHLSDTWHAAMRELGIREAATEIITAYSDPSGDEGTIIRSIFNESNVNIGIRLIHACPPLSSPSDEADRDRNEGRSDTPFPRRLHVHDPDRYKEMQLYSAEERTGFMVWPGHATSNMVFCNPVAEYEQEVELGDCWDIQSFDQTYNAFKEYMLRQLQDQEDFKIYLEYIFPVKRYMALSTIFSTSVLAGYSTMPSLMEGPKLSLGNVFTIMCNRNDFGRKGHPLDNIGAFNLSNSEMMNQQLRQMDQKASGIPCLEGPGLPDFKEMMKLIWELIKYTPSLIFRGTADALDPAYQEMKHHWVNCEMDDFTWVSFELDREYRGSVMDWGSEHFNDGWEDKTTAEVSVPLGVTSNGQYVPIVPGFPVDLFGKLFQVLDSIPNGEKVEEAAKGMGRSVDKFVTYVFTGNLPMLDPNFAFAVPCLDLDAATDWDKYEAGKWGRYGHPLSPLTALALLTPILPGEVIMRETAACALPEDPAEICIEEE